MNEILDLPIEKYPGIKFDCSCGDRHELDIEYLSFGSGVINNLKDAVRPYADKKIFLFADVNTDKVAGEKAYSLLKDAGLDVQYYIFPDEGHDLYPDETSLGRILINMRPDTGLFIGAGSGVINDLGKYASMTTGIPHMIVCTAPSMDGYLSNSSSMTCENKKLSLHTVLPAAVLGDTDILRKAPESMIQSGFGDMLGKLTALADWKLAETIAHEHFCDTSAELVKRAIDGTLKNAEGIAKRDDGAIDALIQGLVLTGVSMTLVSQSRPASGAEHMLSHYWEMEFHKTGKPVWFHGTKVGIATPVIARMFEKMRDMIPEEAMALAPTSEECRKYLEIVGLPLTPADVGVDRELFLRSMREAYTVRHRYSILQLAVETGCIDRIANEIADEIY